MTLLKLLKSIHNAGSNLTNNSLVKFFAFIKFIIHHPHTKTTHKHIKKHHKKILGFSGGAILAHFLVIKFAVIKIFAAKIIILLLTSLGIYNTGIHQEVSANITTGQIEQIQILENINEIRNNALFNFNEYNTNTGYEIIYKNENLTGELDISSFDGNHSIVFDHKEKIDYSSGISISTRIKFSGNTNNATIIENDKKYSLKLYPYENGNIFRIALELYHPKRDDLSLSWDQKITNHNDRYHIVSTYDNQFIKIYIDGELITQKETSGNIKSNNKESISIGEDFSGFIDEINIFNYSLSQDQINTLNLLKHNLLTGTIEIGDVLTGNVLTGKLLTGELLTGSMASGELLTGSISSGDVLTGKLLTGELLTGNIDGNISSGTTLSGTTETGTLSTGKLLTGSISSGNVLTGAIKTGDILNGKLLTGNISSGELLTGNILTGNFSSEFINIKNLSGTRFVADINTGFKSLSIVQKTLGEQIEKFDFYNNNLVFLDNFNTILYSGGENYLTKINDELIYNNLGQQTGINIINNGIFGKSLSLDGNQIIKYKNVEQSKTYFDSGITISTRIKIPGDQKYSTIINKPSEYSLKLYPYDNGDTFRLSFNLYHPKRDDLSLSWDQRISNHDDRYHIVATYDNQFMKIYIDGELITQKVTSGTIKSHTKGTISIGENFSGFIDEVSIFNYPLSQKNIEILNNSSLHKITDNKWKLETNIFNKDINVFGIEILDNGNQIQKSYIDISTLTGSKNNCTGTTNNSGQNTTISGDILTGSDIIDIYQRNINNVEADIDSSIQKMTILSIDQNNINKTFDIYDDSLILMSNFDNHYNLSGGIFDTGIAYDLSPNNYSGSINGAISTNKGKNNASLFFNGDSTVKYDNIKGSRSMYDSGITLSTWIKFSGDNGESTIISKSSEYLLKTFSYNSGQYFKVSFDIYNPKRNDLSLSWYQKIANNNDRYHIVATYDNQFMKIYINGELITQKETSNTIKSHTKGNITIGKDFNGYIDEVYIYNYGLSTDEVKILNNFNLDKFDYEFQEMSANFAGQTLNNTKIIGVEILNQNLEKHTKNLEVNSGNVKNIQDILLEQGFSKKGNKRYGNNNLVMKELNGQICAGDPIIIQGDDTQIEIPECTVVRNKKGQKFKGEIPTPKKIQTQNNNLPENIKIYKTIKIGETDDTIVFTNLEGDSEYVNVRSQLDQGQIGENVVIYYSQDNINRSYLTGSSIKNIDGQKIVEFETNHFTTFVIGGQNGEFFINNGDVYTSGTNVLLSMSGQGITHMKFGNTNEELLNNTRETFKLTKNRQLSGNDGTKTVYAAFSGAGDQIKTTAQIILDTTKPTATISYNPYLIPSLSVLTSITGLNEDIIITNNSGNYNYTFNNNGEFTFEFEDLAGNTGEQTATVTWITPKILNINLIPNLDLSFFGNYSFTSETSNSDSIITGIVEFEGINGDGGNCTSYYASGSCISTTNIQELTYSRDNIREKSNVRPDNIYPQISFADDPLYRDNTPEEILINKNNYSLLHFKNPFTMTGDMNFWIEFNAIPESTNRSRNLTIYLVESGHNISDFNNNRINSSFVHKVGSYSRSTEFDHEHTTNSSHHVIKLSTNSDGTVTTSNLDINGDFWIILYNDQLDRKNKGWKLRYQSGTMCDDYQGRYIGDLGNQTTALQNGGCPDAHIHLARSSDLTDGIKATTKFTYNDGNNTGVISKSSNFYFGQISNLPPNSTQFILPFIETRYNSDINIQRQSATDPNNDNILYNIYLLSATGEIIDTLITGTTSTQYTLDINGLQDGEYSLKGSSCDEEPLCNNFYLEDNFIIDTTAPNATIEYSSGFGSDIIATLTGFSETGVTITNNGGSDTYIFTQNGEFTFEFEDLAGNTGEQTATVTWINKLSIGVPNIFNFSQRIEPKSYDQQFTGQYGTGEYFYINDPLGDNNGWYTTISATHISGQNNDIITNDNLFIKTNGIEILSGQQNSGININNILTNYTPLSGEITYMFRNPGENNGLTGKYGDQPYLKINIPAYQPPGSYSGKIIFTLYEN